MHDAKTLVPATQPPLGQPYAYRLLEDDPVSQYYAQAADAIEIPIEVELRPWARTPVRELADDLRLQAIPSAATVAAATAPHMVAARRARQMLRRVGAVNLRHRARDERMTARRRVAEAELDAYFADRELLVA